MGQKVDPRSLRLGINRAYDSNWYADKNEYITYLSEDLKIREYIEKNYRHAEVSRVFIKRTSSKEVEVSIHTYKVGLIVGRKGAEIASFQNKLNKLVGRKVNVKVVEIPNNIMDARATALNIATAIEKRMPFKRAMNFSLNRAKKSGVKGIKISVSGRLNGQEMARTETVLYGKVPLHTFRYEIDYAVVEARTISGIIGIKVWVSHGERG